MNEMKKTGASWSHSLPFLFFSAVGIFMFFIPVTVKGKSSIPLDHLVTWVRETAGSAVPLYALLVIFLGAAYPFYKKTWNKDKVTASFSVLKVIGLIAAVSLYFNWGPAWLSAPNMGPFLFEKLVIPVGLLVPIGAVFLAFIVGYGLMEFIGVLVQKIMRPVWKTPGRSAVDAVASFVGSYSIGLLITNRVFKEGKYTVKEAAIIATGFSTVSATFMIVVANTLGLMEMWNTFFWTTLAVTFLVTAITVRLRPLSRMDETYSDSVGKPEEAVNEKVWQTAWGRALESSRNAPKFLENICSNLKDGFLMAMSILPSIMSVGLIGLLLAEYTPVFDWIGYLFYPITWALQLPDAMLAAKAVSLGVAEMFLPALLVAEAALLTKFVIGVVSVASILFFSASIPCVLSTEIPISLPKLVIIWFQRTVLSLILATPIAYLLL
jgi:nucleoside recognition membrane protein YjiH